MKNHMHKSCRPRPFSILILGLFLAGCVTAGSDELEQPLSKFTFDLHEFVTGPAGEQTLLTGFLLGSNIADIAVVHIDKNNERRLRIFAFDSSWILKLDTLLHPEVLFVDLANIAGRDRLITYSHAGLNWFDPVTATERSLLAVATNYNAIDKSAIPHIDIFLDLNQDGNDDLLLPDVDGFRISMQLSDGSFSEVMKIGPPEPFRDKIGLEDTLSLGKMGINSKTMPWYQSRVHQMDYNRDGRSDLVFWNVDHFDVYLQDEQGLFSGVPKTFTTDVLFAADGAYSLAFAFSDESKFSLLTGFRGRSKHKVLHSFCDMNGDNIPDLLTQTLEGRSLLNQRVWYEVHFGSETGDGILFTGDSGMALYPQGIATGGSPLGYSLGWWQDLDNDGQVDFIFGRVDTGIIGFFRAILAGSIAMDIEYYRIEGGVYPEQPNGSLKIKPNLEFFDGRGPFFPTVLLGDVNGDNRTDLLVGENWEELSIYMGVAGPDLFAPQPQKVAVALTANEQNARILDFNKDGKQDILIHHPSHSKPNKVILLIPR